MNKKKMCRLDKEDLQRMANMLEGQEPEKEYLRSEYAKVLRVLAEGMCWDDHIQGTGDYTEVSHG